MNVQPFLIGQDWIEVRDGDPTARDIFKRHYSYRPPEKRPSQPGTSQCVVRLDDETFGQIRERAIREGTSFAEQIRLLVEWGLEADE